MTKKSGLQIIPGVGKSIAPDLNRIGIFSVAGLAGRDPEDLYERLCAASGGHVDRCVLYVFRLCVYFAENEARDPELLKWWIWSDKNLARRESCRNPGFSG